MPWIKSTIIKRFSNASPSEKIQYHEFQSKNRFRKWLGEESTVNHILQERLFHVKEPTPFSPHDLWKWLHNILSLYVFVCLHTYIHGTKAMAVTTLSNVEGNFSYMLNI